MAKVVEVYRTHRGLRASASEALENAEQAALALAGAFDAGGTFEAFADGRGDVGVKFVAGKRAELTLEDAYRMAAYVQGFFAGRAGVLADFSSAHVHHVRVDYLKKLTKWQTTGATTVTVVGPCNDATVGASFERQADLPRDVITRWTVQRD